MKIVMVAAGTAGHINPALAIANRIKKGMPEAEITFIGRNEGLEKDLVPREGYPMRSIEAYGFYKEISIDNFKKIYTTLVTSRKKAKDILSELKPDVVIGTGGYICVPVMKAALSLRIPIILHESNAFPGLAIRQFDRSATRILTGFEDTKKYFKYKNNVRHVGNPIKISKKEFTEEEKKKIFDSVGLDKDKKTVLVFGGSQGAKVINDNVLELVSNNFFEKEDYQLIWATGKNNYDEIKEEFTKQNRNIDNLKNVKITPYIYNMEELLNVATLAVTRAGAMTISELSAIGIPSLFIPLPSQKANRQIDNARILEVRGGAKIIENSKLNPSNLESAIKDMLSTDEYRKNMTEVSKKEKTDALNLIYDIVLEVMKEGREKNKNRIERRKK